MRIIISILLYLFITNSQAVTINATKIGPMYTTTPISTIATAALSAFRGPLGVAINAVTVGSMLLKLFETDGTNSLALQPGANVPWATPSGWSGPNSPPSTATAPTASSICTTNFGGAKSDGKTYSYVSSSTTSGNCPSQLSCIMDTVTTGSGGSHFNSEFCTSLGQLTTCQTGYTYSSGSCNLSNASAVQWPNDGVPSYNITGSPGAYSWSSNPRDPDNNASISTPYTRTGTDPYLNPITESVTPNAQGGIDYSRTTQSIDQNTGNPNTQVDKFTTDANGNVTQSSSAVYNNSTVASPSTSSPANQSIDTSSLAKEATLQQTNSKLSDIKTDIEKLAQESDFTPPTNVLPHSDNVLSFTPTMTAAGCCPADITIPVSVAGYHSSFDIPVSYFCTYATYIRAFAIAAATLSGLLIIFV